MKRYDTVYSGRSLPKFLKSVQPQSQDLKSKQRNQPTSGKLQSLDISNREREREFEEKILPQIITTILDRKLCASGRTGSGSQTL
jgi:hypothetical protein